MENVWHILIQILGTLMFVMAITLLLYYVRTYEQTLDNLNRQFKRDAVIINMEK